MALNAERAAEEARGLVRWLRPEYQTRGLRETQSGMEGVAPDGEDAASPAAKVRMAWPKTLPERFQVVAAALTGLGHAA
ncbi:MAG: hypothetical protein IPJ58_13100 [Ardenticatenia bacterium]|nr:hypothetical protein [Ardenticatenia bacterium]